MKYAGTGAWNSVVIPRVLQPRYGHTISASQATYLYIVGSQLLNEVDDNNVVRLNGPRILIHMGWYGPRDDHLTGSGIDVPHGLLERGKSRLASPLLERTHVPTNLLILIS